MFAIDISNPPSPARCTLVVNPCCANTILEDPEQKWTICSVCLTQAERRVM